MKSWKFDFGSSESVKSDFIHVSPEMAYSEERGFGFLGLGLDGYKEDSRSDGFVMEKGEEIVLQSFSRANPKTIEDYGVAVTDPGMPIRFAEIGRAHV